VPIFFRPDQVGYYDSLHKWIRQDFNGTFRDYGSICAAKPEKLLQSKSHVKLFVGVDQMQMKIVKSGWTKDKNIPFRGSIEVNDRLLTKITTPGIAVVTGSENAGYQTQVFTDLSAGEAFIRSIPSDRDRLAVGVLVPASVASKMFTEASGLSGQKGTVGFVAVSGPSYGPTPKVLVGADDVTLDIDWKR
jgi:hypothetical protein